MMNWKSVIVLASIVGTSGIIVLSNHAGAQPAEGAPTVEARLAAIESYLHIGGPDKHQSIVADAKTFDDLKASLIKLEQTQETLDRRIRSTAGQGGGTLGDKVSTDLESTKRDIATMGATIRALDERIRKLEMRIR